MPKYYKRNNIIVSSLSCNRSCIIFSYSASVSLRNNLIWEQIGPGFRVRREHGTSLIVNLSGCDRLADRALDPETYRSTRTTRSSAYCEKWPATLCFLSCVPMGCISRFIDHAVKVTPFDTNLESRAILHFAPNAARASSSFTILQVDCSYENCRSIVN